MQTIVRDCDRGSISCVVHEKKNATTGIFAFAAQTLAAAHALRIYFGRTSAPHAAIATLGHGAETLHNRPLHVPSHRGGSGRAWSNNMPDSCRRRDGEEELRDQENIVSVISQFVDDHLTFVRVGSAMSPTLQLLGRASVDADSQSSPQHACASSRWKPVKVVHLDVFISVRVSLTEHQHRPGCRWSCYDSEKSETGEGPALLPFYPSKQSDQCNNIKAHDQ